MKSVVLHEHGPIENLTFEPEFPDPAVAEDEVLIRVHACSLNYHDVFTVRGMPGIRIPMPVIVGIDVAGEIVSVGRNVHGWQEGDRILVDPIDRVRGGLIGETRHGGLAEYCVVHSSQLIRLPEDIGFAEASTLPVAYGTAHRMVVVKAAIQSDEIVLLLGASGGVGVASLQLAKLAGATVIACAGTDEKCERLQSLGADYTINYQKENFLDAVRRLVGKPKAQGPGGGVDVVLNFTGGDTWVPSLKCLRRGGRLVTCGATAGFDPKEDIRYIWTFELQIQGSNGWLREDLTQLLELYGSGRLKLPIHHTFPLEESQQALRVLERREVLGKVVVAP
jgi:NADPH:quinone reductase-like Zn-dependent oxidoreductase